MKRILAALAATAVLLGTAACSSSAPLDVQPPPGAGTGSGGAETTVLSPQLERALRSIDCEQIALQTVLHESETAAEPESTDDDAPADVGIPVLTAGTCVPFAGREQVEFYEFDNPDSARTWASSDAPDLASVDNVYISESVIIVDRRNDYLVQLILQLDPV